MDDYRFAQGGRPEEDYYARVARILDQMRGGGTVGSHDRRTLQDALTRLAPADPMYRRIVAATGIGADPYGGAVGRTNVMPGDASEGKAPSFWDTLGKTLTDPRGLPTGDFMGRTNGAYEDNPASTTGPARPEPGNTRPASTTTPSPAAVSDAMGSRPIGSGGISDFPGMGDNPGPGFMTNQLYSNTSEQDLLDMMSAGPEGDYAVNDLPLATRELVTQNPELFANILYEDSPIQREVMQPYIESAQALSSTGMLGYGTGGSGLDAGPSSSTMQMAAMEDMMRTFENPGMQFVDPSQVYSQMFSRTENTDPELMVDSEGRSGIYSQIEVTNNALANAAPYMTDNARQYLGARLDQARMEYLTMIAKGETDMTYPQYLKSVGADTWLQEE